MFFDLTPSYKHHLSIDHIAGNKSRIGSIGVPFDREHPDEQHTKFPHIVIHFDGRGWPSK
jgi:hypothetical protein